LQESELFVNFAPLIFHGVKVKEVKEALERFAPLPLQEEYDNAGLQTGLLEAEVSGALLCLDVTEDVLQEAVDCGYNLVVSHHPLLFRPLRQVSDFTLGERCVRFAVKHDIAIYAAHTNLDNAHGGVNFEIARRLGLKKVTFLQTQDGKSGSGIVGDLTEAENPEAFMKRVKSIFEVECLAHNVWLNRMVKRVALCGGAGDFLINEAVKAGADAFLTGEMKYHLFFGLEGRIQIGVLGHYQSEQFTKNLLHDILQEALPGLPLKMTQMKTNPIYYL